ncbi:MAG: tetratricopeptide repeat protein, partial [Planctomycetota bacterium]
LDRFDEAERHYHMALPNNPESAAAQGNLADLLVRRGRHVEGAKHFLEAIDKKPRWAALLRRMGDLAWLLATHPDDEVRNGEWAVRLAGRVCREHDSPPPDVLATFAAAYAELGLFEEAIQTAEKALEEARKEKLRALVIALLGQMDLYRAGKPVRAR